VGTYFSKYRVTRVQLRRRALAAKILPIIAAGGAVFAVTQLFPQAPLQNKSTRVFEDGLHIELDHTSPAFAAMEDTLLGDKLTEYESSKTPELTAAVSMLEAGHSAVAMAEQIVRENHRESMLMAQARATREANEQKMGQAVADAFEKLAVKLGTPNNIKANAGSGVGAAPKAAGANAQASATSLDLNHAGALSPGVTHPVSFKLVAGSNSRQAIEQSRNEAAAQVKETYESSQNIPTQTISLAQLGITREQFMREFFLPLATADVSDAPPTTMVAGAQAGDLDSVENSVHSLIDRAGSGRRNRNAMEAAGLRIGGMNPSAPDRSHRPSPGLGKPLNAESVTTEAYQNVHQLVLGGHFEFEGGLALANSTDTVVVYRDVDGRSIEKGATWLREARFEIFVERPQGTLIAELRTVRGEVLGRGSFDLSDLPKVSTGQIKVDSISMKITPLPQGMSGQILSTNSAQKFIHGAQVQFENLPFAAVSLHGGNFEEPNLMEGSSAFLTTQKKGFWPTRTGASAGLVNAISLLSEKTIQALEAAKGPTRESHMGLAMGRVLRNGKPVAGAQVELASNDEARKAVYFDAKMQPDLSLEATTENGLYAYYPLPEGTYNARAAWGPAISDSTVFTVNEHISSQVDLEVGQTHIATLKAFDAFRTDWPLAAGVVKTGSGEKALSVSPSGSSPIKFSGGATMLSLDIDGGNSYEPVRVSAGRSQKLIYLPLIQTTWINNIRGALKINKQPRSGVIVGFIQGSTQFQVSMDEKSIASSSRLVYFNSRGEISDKSYGEPGGGFVIFNVPDGYRTAMVQASGLSQTFAATVLVDERFVNVVNHWMR
jgi:hypothetical protein